MRLHGNMWGGQYKRCLFSVEDLSSGKSMSDAQRPITVASVHRCVAPSPRIRVVPERVCSGLSEFFFLIKNIIS